MEERIKAATEGTTRCVVTEVVKESIEDTFTGCINEQT